MMVVSLAGSPSQRSRSGVLLDVTGDWLQRRGVEVVRYAVRDFEPADLIHARFDSPAVQRFAEPVEQADGGNRRSGRSRAGRLRDHDPLLEELELVRRRGGCAPRLNESRSPSCKKQEARKQEAGKNRGRFPTVFPGCVTDRLSLIMCPRTPVAVGQPIVRFLLRWSR